MGYSERLSTAIILTDTRHGRRAIGTGVFVQVGGLGDDVAAMYIVTARHVHENAEGPVYVRLTRRSGMVEDQLISRWFYNIDSHEVAVGRCTFSEQEYRLSALYPNRLSDTFRSLEEHREHSKYIEGREVYFIGAYPKIEAMTDQNRTMIRAGLLGLTWQDRVRVTNRKTRVELMHTVHLIDCYAHSGFSGAPCFIVNVSEDDLVSIAHSRKSARGDATVGEPVITTEDFRRLRSSRRETWELIGILLGHFPHSEKAFDIAAPQEDTTLHVEVNAGIGLVVPIGYVAATLMQDDVLHDRRLAPPPNPLVT